MKKLLTTLLIVALALTITACKESEPEVPINEEENNVLLYSVQLEFNCVENLLFSKYDIEIFVDGDKIGKLDHGATRTYSVELEEGMHTLVAAKEGSKSIDGTIDFTISEDSKFKYELSCTSKQVKIKEIIQESDIEKDDAENGAETPLRTVSGFDAATNQEILFGGLRFSFPAYFDTRHEESTDTNITYYPEEEDCYCSLIFMEQDGDLSQAEFDQRKSLLADTYLKLVTENIEVTSVVSESTTIAGLSGWTISFVETDTEDLTTVNWSIVFNPQNEKVIYIMMGYGSNDQSNYDYVGDYKKILQSAVVEDEAGNQVSAEADKNDSKTESSNKAQTGDSLSYSTNNRETAKKGNSGVFAYRSTGGTYYNYWIIDFDEGYVYSFSEGNGSSTCDRLAIESGDLNSVLIITYHDGGDEWSYGLNFKRKNLPDTLILQDNNGFEYEFFNTDLNNALKVRDSKTIKDY